MTATNFDLDALRSFVAGVELGSFARAAERVHRSPSALSAQLRKLEAQAGEALVRKNGRTLALTDAGEALLGYARRMLDLNDEALLALRGRRLAGSVRLGLQEDFSEHVLADVLGAFARSHPGVRIEVKVERNVALLDGVRDGRLDLALAWHAGRETPHMVHLGVEPLYWIGARPAAMAPPVRPVPLVAFDAPCRLRSAATDALDAAGIGWRIAVECPSLGGIWAGVAAGLGLTVRTRFGLPAALAPLPDGALGLPPLAPIGLALHRSRARLPAAAARLQALLCERVSRPA